MSKTTNINDFAQLLEVFRAGLSQGLIEKQTIIKWADNIIQADDEPDIRLIELSLSGSQSIPDFQSQLTKIIGQADVTVSGRVLIGLIYVKYIKGELNFEKIPDKLYWLIYNTSQLSSDEKNVIYDIDHRYSMLSMFGNMEKMKNLTLPFLEIYQEFRIDNFDKWSLINDSIEKKLKLLLDKSSVENSQRNLKVKKVRKWWQIWK